MTADLPARQLPCAVVDDAWARRDGSRWSRAPRRMIGAAVRGGTSRSPRRSPDDGDAAADPPAEVGAFGVRIKHTASLEGPALEAPSILDDEQGPPSLAMTDADFTSWYEGYRGRYRYDLVDGFAHVFDMAGATPMRGRLVGEIAARLRPHVLARGCDVITNDIAVSPRPGTIYYPDIAVTCDDADLAVVDTTPWKHPSLIVEVASRSTQSNDLDAKARAYLAMGAEYVIFSSLARKVLLDGRVARERLAGAPLLIRTFGVELDVDGIYDAVRMPRALPAS